MLSLQRERRISARDPARSHPRGELSAWLIPRDHPLVDRGAPAHPCHVRTRQVCDGSGDLVGEGAAGSGEGGGHGPGDPPAGLGSPSLPRQGSALRPGINRQGSTGPPVGSATLGIHRDPGLPWAWHLLGSIRTPVLPWDRHHPGPTGIPALPWPPSPPAIPPPRDLPGIPPLTSWLPPLPHAAGSGAAPPLQSPPRSAPPSHWPARPASPFRLAARAAHRASRRGRAQPGEAIERRAPRAASRAPSR